MSNTPINFVLTLIIFATTGFFAFAVYATSGTIDNTYKYAWSENLGWINFGSSQGSVSVTDTALTGYAWSENAGWVSLNCSNTSSCDTIDYKVTNTTSGILGGYAWGENIGWINFAPTNGGVTIDSSGRFKGYAWGENTGWIIFNCTTTSSCGNVTYRVQTDWLPPNASPEVSSGGGGGEDQSPLPSEQASPSTSVTPLTSSSVSPTLSTSPTVTPTVTSTVSPTGTLQPSQIPVFSSSVQPSQSPPLTEPNQPPPSLIPSVTPPEIVIKVVGQKAAESLIRVVEQAQPITFTAVSAVTVSTAVSAAALATQGVSLANYFAYAYQSLLILFGLKKRGKPWGTVYNAVTKQPLPFVKVQILNKENRVMETRITDRNGRYDFLATAETLSSTMLEFYLRVDKAGYNFPSRHVTGKTDTVLYDHVYLGGLVTRKPDEPVNFDIPIDPVTPVSTQEKIKIPAMRLHNLLVLLTEISFWIAVTVLPLSALFRPTVFNLTMLVIFVIINGLRAVGDLRERPYGITYDLAASRPLPYTLITLKDNDGIRKGFAVSDDRGRYVLLTEKGKFDLDAVTPADIQPQRSTHEMVESKRGWIAKQISI